MHNFNDKNKCVYCGSTKEMIEKYHWKCSDDRVPLDRIINEDIYTQQRVKSRIEKLSKSTDPWERIIYNVHYVDNGKERLSELEMEYYLLNCLLGETMNGGIEQYFGNSSGDDCLECLYVLKRYGHNEMHDGLAHIIKHFCDGKILGCSAEVRERINASRIMDGEMYWEFWKTDAINKLEVLMDSIEETIKKLHVQLMSRKDE